MSLGISTNLVVKIHPVVLYAICDSYERRNDSQYRVIGSLLGVHEKGAVEITNCICIPHTETEDEVAVDMEFAKSMYESYKKVNPSEVIVGWYATGADVTNHSLLIHDYYSREANNPVHLIVDTSLSEGKLTWKAFTSVTYGISSKNPGTMFTPCRTEIFGYTPELVGLKMCQKTKNNKQRSTEISSDLDMVGNAIEDILKYTDIVLNYVDEVLSNRKVADSAVGRSLMDMIQSLPPIDSEQFVDMINTSMKDILMIVFLSQLIRSQTSLQEKVSCL